MKSEREFIKSLQFLTNSNKNAFALQDDLARLNKNTLVNTDTTIEGVHILKGLSPKFIAYKAIARSVSDVLAKGAQPFAFMLNIILPQNFTLFEDLIDGFKEFTSIYKMDLLGGDTSVHGNDITICATVFARSSKNILRSSAKVGDGIFLTKKVGSAYLGMLECQQFSTLSQNALEYLKPSLSTIDSWEKINASMDVSDGLLVDANKMATASQKCFEIDFAIIPFAASENKEEMLKFGDDYNILFTSKDEIPNAVKIGTVKKGNGVSVINSPFEIKPFGFDHFNTFRR